MASDMNKHIPRVPVYVLAGPMRFYPYSAFVGIVKENVCSKVPMWGTEGHGMWYFLMLLPCLKLFFLKVLTAVFAQNMGMYYVLCYMINVFANYANS